MKKQFFNIQLFATDVTTAGKTTTYSGRLSVEEAHEYYDRTLNQHVYDSYDMEKYFDQITLPKNNGKSMVLRKLGRYTLNMNPLIEGFIPDQDAPMATYEYRVNLQDYAGYTTYTDTLDIYSLNSGWATRIQENQAEALGEELQKKAYQIMCTSKNRWFAGVSSPTGDLATIRAGLSTINLDDFRKIRTFLQRTKVKPFDNNEYLVLISPEVAEDLFSLTKTATGSNMTFVEILNAHQNDKVFTGEIGSWMGFRFVVSNAIKSIATATVSSTTQYIHGCLILGKYHGEKGAKLVKLEGKGKPETIIKDVTSGGARENPVNQIGSIGWRIDGWGGTVLYSEAVMVYECFASAVADEFDDLERDALVNGTDGAGTSYSAPTDNVGYNSGTKLSDLTVVVNVVQGVLQNSVVTGSIVGTYLYDIDTLVSTVASDTGYTLVDASGSALTTTDALSALLTSGNVLTVYTLLS